MGLRALNYMLATVGFAGHVLLTVELIRRKLALRLPVFTILIVFYVLRSRVFLLGSFAAISVWPAFCQPVPADAAIVR